MRTNVLKLSNRKGNVNIRQQRNKGMKKGKLTKKQRERRRIATQKIANKRWYDENGKAYYRAYYKKNRDRCMEIFTKYRHTKKGMEAEARYEAQPKRKLAKKLAMRKYRKRDKLKKQRGKK